MDDKNIGKIREEVEDDRTTRKIDKMQPDEVLLVGSVQVMPSDPQHDYVTVYDGSGRNCGTLVFDEGQGIHIARRLIPMNVESGEPR